MIVHLYYICYRIPQTYKLQYYYSRDSIEKASDVVPQEVSQTRRPSRYECFIFLPI